MRNVSFKNFVALSILIIVSCTPVLKVSTEHDEKIDFSKYKTFSFYGFTDKGSGISELNRKRVIAAVISEMKSKGLTETEEKPDLFVNAATILKEKSKVSNTNYYGYGGVFRPYYWGPGNNTNDINVYDYKEGSIIIDVLDASTNTLIWQGIGNSEIDTPLKDADIFIQKAVKKILKDFPRN